MVWEIKYEKVFFFAFWNNKTVCCWLDYNHVVPQIYTPKCCNKNIIKKKKTCGVASNCHDNNKKIKTSCVFAFVGIGSLSKPFKEVFYI